MSATSEQARLQRTVAYIQASPVPLRHNDNKDDDSGNDNRVDSDNDHGSQRGVPSPSSPPETPRLVNFRATDSPAHLPPASMAPGSPSSPRAGPPTRQATSPFRAASRAAGRHHRAQEHRVPACEPSWDHTLRVRTRFLSSVADDRVRALFDEFECIAIKSAQGTGKTRGLLFTELQRLILHSPRPPRVLWLSIRRGYKDTLWSGMEEYFAQMKPLLDLNCGFRKYTDRDFPNTPEGNAKLAAQERIICSLESLPRLLAGGAAAAATGGTGLQPYDLIVLDEVMQLHFNFHGQTMSKQRRRSFELLCQLCQHSPFTRIWAADADLIDATALPFLRGLNGDRPIGLLHNTQPTIRRTYHQAACAVKLQAHLVDLLQQGQKVVVACSTRTRALAISMDPAILALSHLKVVVLTAKSPEDVHKKYIQTTANWGDADLLIYSPVISSGSDYNVAHFDCAFFFGDSFTTTARQAFQQLNRVRQLQTSNVYFHMQLYAGAQNEHLPVSFADVQHSVSQRVAAMTTDTFDYVRTGQAGRGYCFDTEISRGSGLLLTLKDTLYNGIFIRNQLEVHLSQRFFRELILSALVEAGGAVVPWSSKVFIEHEEYVRHHATMRELSAAELQEIMDARDLPSDDKVQQAEQRVHAKHGMQLGDAAAVDKARVKKLYGIPLTDTRTMRETPDFGKDFAAKHRQYQFNNMKVASKGGAARSSAAADLDTDYHCHLITDFECHAWAEQALLLLGFQPSRLPAADDDNNDEPDGDTAAPLVYCAPLPQPSILFSASRVWVVEQADRWQRDPRLQTSALKLLHHPTIKASGWLQRYSRDAKDEWKITTGAQPADVYDLVVLDATGTAQEQADARVRLLFDILRVGLAHHLKEHFGVKLKLGHRKSREEKGYSLDRRHWDLFARSVLGQAPQQPDASKWAAYRTSKRQPKAVAGSAPPRHPSHSASASRPAVHDADSERERTRQAMEQEAADAQEQRQQAIEQEAAERRRPKASADKNTRRGRSKPMQDYPNSPAWPIFSPGEQNRM